MRQISGDTYEMVKVWYAAAVYALCDDPDEVVSADPDEIRAYFERVQMAGWDLGLDFWELAKEIGVTDNLSKYLEDVK